MKKSLPINERPKLYIGWNLLIGFLTVGILHGIYYLGCLFSRLITGKWLERDPISFLARVLNKYREKREIFSDEEESESLIQTNENFLSRLTIQSNNADSESEKNSISKFDNPESFSSNSSSSSFFNSKSETVDEAFSIFIMGDVELGNTPLHKAIARNQTQDALTLIKNISSDEINIKAGGNTPLMLALKKGNLIVAQELLKHQEINVKAHDTLGLTALHWAAILRADEIIESLLDKGAEIFDEEDCDPVQEEHMYHGFHPEMKLSHSTAPRDIYTLNPLENYFFDYYQEDYELSPLRFNPELDKLRYEEIKAQHNGAFPVHFADFHPGIKKAIAYSDIVFHIADICHNMGWVTDNMCEKYAECQKETSSIVAFKKAFLFSYVKFLEERNALPVNANIVERLSMEFNQDTSYVPAVFVK